MGDLGGNGPFSKSNMQSLFAGVMDQLEKERKVKAMSFAILYYVNNIYEVFFINHSLLSRAAEFPMSSLTDINQISNTLIEMQISIHYIQEKIEVWEKTPTVEAVEANFSAALNSISELKMKLDSLHTQIAGMDTQMDKS